MNPYLKASFYLIIQNLIERRICGTSILHLLVVLLLDFERKERAEDGKDENDEEDDDDDDSDIDRVAAGGDAEEPGQAVIADPAPEGGVGEQTIQPLEGLNFSVDCKVY